MKSYAKLCIRDWVTANKTFKIPIDISITTGLDLVTVVAHFLCYKGFTVINTCDKH